MLRLVIILIVTLAMPASADPAFQPAERLDAELDRLESRVVQRQKQTPRTSDLLTRQDLKVAERRLWTLKTRRPRDTSIPRLGLQLDRLQRRYR